MSDTYEYTISELPEDNYAARLSVRERQIRENFVQEYFVDYDAFNAAVRIGYRPSVAREYAGRFMSDAYVQQLMKKHEQQDQEENTEQMRRRIIQGLIREANYKGPGASASARVAAFAKLAAIQGLDTPKAPDANPYEGVFVVPGTMTSEQWAAAAKTQQEDLISGKTPAVEQMH